MYPPPHPPGVSRFTHLEFNPQQMIFAFQCLHFFHAFRSILSFNPNKYETWKITKFSLKKTGPSDPYVLFPSEIHRVGITKPSTIKIEPGAPSVSFPPVRRKDSKGDDSSKRHLLSPRTTAP